MERENDRLPVRYEPRFIEEAVFLALREGPDARLFYRQRNALYEIGDPEERERAFQSLHQAWFPRLGLADQIEKAIHEQPLLAPAVGLCLVICAPARREEGADLLVSPEERLSGKERRTLRILLRPESLHDPLALLTFLRHELLHITDMLDPHFGYEPVLPVAEAGPPHDRLVRDRYRVLWDATIDGRMVRRGWAPESIRIQRLKDFGHTFPMFEEETAQVFARFFDQERHKHAELVAFAQDPRAAVRVSRETPHPGGRCPLCAFPTYSFKPEPESLPAEVIAHITRDFPQWHPADGLCLQCADLYMTRIQIGTAHSDFQKAVDSPIPPAP
jgi:hypothetical protein